MINEGNVGSDWVIAEFGEGEGDGGFDFVVIRNVGEFVMTFFGDAEL